MEKLNKSYYMYVLLTADNTLYTGFTDDVAKRFKAHQEFRGAKFTKIKRKHPLKLIYSEQFATKEAALSAEWHFKHQTRQQKVAYLASKEVYI
ncbi:GIY-YIG nuclease family protein [Periweissella beninensis]|uniref:GIY-YIG nuclease family protein n=1 Tax=Periweissella beninensis TaxID=504936 RepID=A0ABT0VFB4_9LACO|nr:GIY-YIG nuclease family protein [Periweissella beninensis]MBM7543560.1 putative endonuclease [Periweissella beninensis]MCM2436542.1 GIY-YIG nuclease family protein [Periweissella beninensis]MCT4396259.1 GIY-YIG nuclease family protein [Periweissella beninensis]